MSREYDFDKDVFSSLLAGLSAIDVPRLNIQSLEEAHHFLAQYGYDIHSSDDVDDMWRLHARAKKFLETKLLETEEKIPSILANKNELKDVGYLLIYASSEPKPNSLQQWSCAILRIMHILVHLENDLFRYYYKDIQNQIINPFLQYVEHSSDGKTLLKSARTGQSIELVKFTPKSFKSVNSSIIKLLVKPEAVAFQILDKVGVRIITKSLFDVFRVLKFFMEESLVSFPHLIPDQSNNTVFPLNVFLSVMEDLKGHELYSEEEVDRLLNERLMSSNSIAIYKKKHNTFSSKDYKFIKFIGRKLIQTQENKIKFFYPFEVQIMDQKTYDNNEAYADHSAYKERQRLKARKRIFGDLGESHEL